MENVPGLLGTRGRSHSIRLRDILSNLGYAVQAQLVNAAEYGVPQIRRRVFLYGWLRDSVSPFSFPSPLNGRDNFRTVSDAIGDLPSPPDDHSAHPGDPLHRRMRMSKLNAERLLHVPPGGGMAQLPVRLRVNAHKNGADRIGHRYVYGRLSYDKPASTITARFDSFTRGKFAHPTENRNISLREGARLQTFPDDFIFEGTQEQIAALIGNAVPPLLAETICRHIARHLAEEIQPFGPLDLNFSQCKNHELIEHLKPGAEA
jgi:DNA (cytosine-5)-methyltransferase 1